MAEYTIEERSEKLADTLFTESIKKLPRPLQTLLEALAELKCDYAKDIERQKSNHLSVCISVIDSAIKYCIDVMKHAEDEFRKIDIYDDIDEKLRLEVSLFLENEVEPSKWIPLLRKKCQTLRQQFHKEIEKTTTKNPLTRPRIKPSSVSKAESAVIYSTVVRDRLKELSTGSLKAYFDEPSSDSMQVHEEIEATTNHTIENADSSKVSNGHSLLRKTLQFFYAKVQIKKILIDDILLSSIHSMRSVARNLQYQQSAIEQDQDMKNADSKLQNEIKYLLQTLSSDQVALDQVLRSIVKKTEYISIISEKESYTQLSLCVTRWRLSLTDAKTSIDISSQLFDCTRDIVA